MMPRVAISDLCQLNPKKGEVKELGDSLQVTFCGMSDLTENGEFKATESRRLGDVRKGYTYFAEGDLLFAKITPCMENGKGGVATGLVNAVGFGSSEFHVLRPLEGVDTRYLHQFLQAPQLRAAAEEVMTGSAGQKRVPKDFFKNCMIPLPSLAEQKRIAGILDEADRVRKKTQALIDKYDELAQSLFLDMFGDPVTNPKKLEVGTIGQLAAEVKYGTSSKASEFGDLPYLRMNNITYSGHMDLGSLKFIDLSDDVPYHKYGTRRGDILFNRTNSRELVGKTGLVRSDEKMILAGYLIRVRLSKGVVPEYVWSWMNSQWVKTHLRNLCRGIVGQANINAQELKSIPIPIAPFELQSEFKDKLTEIESQKDQALMQLREGKTLFNALLQKAFNGELN